jgi:hypothetical protein
MPDNVLRRLQCEVRLTRGDHIAVKARSRCGENAAMLRRSDATWFKADARIRSRHGAEGDVAGLGVLLAHRCVRVEERHLRSIFPNYDQ